MNAKEQLKNRIEVLNSYEKSIGLVDRASPGSYEELKSYLGLTKDQLVALDTKTAYSIAARLSQYSIYFKRCINEEKANKTYAQAELNKSSASEYQQYDNFIKNDIKLSIIAKSNQAVHDWLSILTYAQQRIDRLEGISEDIKNLAYILTLIGKENKS